MSLRSFAAIILLAAATTNAYSQQLQVPDKWKVEKFSLPPQFATSLPLKGTEDIRFSPDWGNKDAPGYWTYCFLWTLQGNVSFTAAKLEQYFQAYYTGLIQANTGDSKTDTLTNPVKAHMHKSRKSSNDAQTYEGTVALTDYMTHHSMVLNMRIHIKKQTPASGTTVVYIEASPQPYPNNAWVIPDMLDKTIR